MAAISANLILLSDPTPLVLDGVNACDMADVIQLVRERMRLRFFRAEEERDCIMANGEQTDI
jgi:hypothetical protein